MPDLNEGFIPASGYWRARDASVISLYFIIIFVVFFVPSSRKSLLRK